MASLGSNKELEATANGKSHRTSLIFNLDGKEDFTLCSLVNDKIEQQVLDLVLTEGETIAFRVDGPNAIHLSGYYINEDEEDDGFINDEDEDEVYSDEAEEDSQIEYDSELEDDEDDSEEDSEEEGKSKKNARIRVIESDEEEEDDEEFDSEEDDEDFDSEEEMDSEEESEEEESEEEEEKVVSPKKVKVEEVKKVKETSPAKEAPKPAANNKVTPPAAKASPAPAATPAKPAAPQPAKEQGPNPVKNTLPSGLTIEDLKLGNGPKVSQGKSVLIHYKGTLLNGQVFDSSFGGKPLKFAVGKGQVIKGMDIGIVGMAVGGSRKLVIPGPLAYGNQALPKIPRNSTLVFEIRLEKIL